MFYLRIARCGYEYDQYHAFFPGLPALVGLLRRSGKQFCVAAGGPAPAAQSHAGFDWSAWPGSTSTWGIMPSVIVTGPVRLLSQSATKPVEL